MRIRILLSASAVALVAASCSQPEPQVLSEAPRSTSATDLTSAATTTERDAEPGRFIARCATEADGGAPGMTVFTDGTQSVTDHCLSRYYIGVQPAPGALYVPDEDTGTYAPSRRTTDASTPTQQWTPAQPRTDAGAEKDETARDQLQKDTDLEVTTDTDEETTPDDAPVTSNTPDTPDTEAPTSDDTPTTTTPTKPGETTSPGDTEPTRPTTPGETDPTTPGSSEPLPTTTVPVPTVTETPDPSPSTSQTSVTSTAPSGPLGSTGSHGTMGSGLSESLQGSAPAPTYVPFPLRGPR